MRLRVLGAYAPYAPAEGACNSYLLEHDETRVMLDCGNGSFAQLQKYLDFRLLDALIITHYHPDHFHDYHCIRHAIAGSIRDESRKEPLEVIAPREGAAWQEMKEWDGVFCLVPLEDYVGQALKFKELDFIFLENIHTVRSYGVSIDDGNNRIVYTGDTAWFEGLSEFAAKADLLICEASVLNSDEETAQEKGHLTAGQAGRLADKAQVKHLVLTHLWPELEHGSLLKEAQAAFKGEITLAKGGISYNLMR